MKIYRFPLSTVDLTQLSCAFWHMVYVDCFSKFLFINYLLTLCLRIQKNTVSKASSVFRKHGFIRKTGKK